MRLTEMRAYHSSQLIRSEAPRRRIDFRFSAFMRFDDRLNRLARVLKPKNDVFVVFTKIRRLVGLLVHGVPCGDTWSSLYSKSVVTNVDWATGPDIRDVSPCRLSEIKPKMYPFVVKGTMSI